MALQDLIIFENQNIVGNKQVGNFGDLDDFTFQVNCDSSFELQVFGRINPQYPFEPMNTISNTFEVVSSIQSNGIYSLSIPRKITLEFRLLSIDGGSINCCASIN